MGYVCTNRWAMCKQVDRWDMCVQSNGWAMCKQVDRWGMCVQSNRWAMSSQVDRWQAVLGIASQVAWSINRPFFRVMIEP